MSLPLQGDRGNKALDLGCLGVLLAALLLGSDLAANDVLAHIIVLGQVLEDKTVSNAITNDARESVQTTS